MSEALETRKGLKMELHYEFSRLRYEVATGLTDNLIEPIGESRVHARQSQRGFGGLWRKTRTIIQSDEQFASFSMRLRDNDSQGKIVCVVSETGRIGYGQNPRDDEITIQFKIDIFEVNELRMWIGGLKMILGRSDNLRSTGLIYETNPF